jgi:hypothetical protein
VRPDGTQFVGDVIGVRCNRRDCLTDRGKSELALRERGNPAFVLSTKAATPAVPLYQADPSSAKPIIVLARGHSPCTHATTD